MEVWTDWRYRLVNAVDAVFHVAFPRHELPGLCNLERRMWWDRYHEHHPT